ncbi:unnamed protein product [Rhodiola kirilowii]
MALVNLSQAPSAWLRWFRISWKTVTVIMVTRWRCILFLSGVAGYVATVFNGVDGSSDDEPDCFGGCFGESNPSSSLDACETLKSLVLCSSVVEHNLLGDVAKIVEKNKICKQGAEGCRELVTDGLVALGYNSSICKSCWEKTPSYPAGEYRYIDVVHEGERFLVDVDFRSEFEIARPTKTYKTILQAPPCHICWKVCSSTEDNNHSN